LFCVFGISALMSLGACGVAHINPAGVGYATPSLAVLTTPGVRIEALDDDWVIEAGEAFVPPFVFPVDFWESSATPDELHLAVNGYSTFGVTAASEEKELQAVYLRFVPPNTPIHNAGLDGAWVHSVEGARIHSNNELFGRLGTNRARAGERRDVRFRRPGQSSLETATIEAVRMPSGFRVRIHHPASSKPLYGRLAFFRVITPTDSSPRRQWTIAISDEKIRMATGGRVATVYQPYDFTYHAMRGTRTFKGTRVSWVLWMSDIEQTFGPPNHVALGVNMEEAGDGVRILYVAPGSAAAIAGVRQGDVLISLAGEPVRAITEVQTIVRRHRPGDSMPFSLVRDGNRFELNARFGPALH